LPTGRQGLAAQGSHGPESRSPQPNHSKLIPS
jgi:hypothetical protein